MSHVVSVRKIMGTGTDGMVPSFLTCDIFIFLIFSFSRIFFSPLYSTVVDLFCGIKQCCGSGMFILDPGSRIPDPNFSIPDPGSIRFRIFYPNNCFQALGNMIRDVHPGFFCICVLGTCVGWSVWLLGHIFGMPPLLLPGLEPASPCRRLC